MLFISSHKFWVKDHGTKSKILQRIIGSEYLGEKMSISNRVIRLFPTTLDGLLLIKQEVVKRRQQRKIFELQSTNMYIFVGLELDNGILTISFAWMCEISWHGGLHEAGQSFWRDICLLWKIRRGARRKAIRDRAPQVKEDKSPSYSRSFG